MDYEKEALAVGIGCARHHEAGDNEMSVTTWTPENVMTLVPATTVVAPRILLPRVVTVSVTVVAPWTVQASVLTNPTRLGAESVQALEAVLPNVVTP